MVGGKTVAQICVRNEILVYFCECEGGKGLGKEANGFRGGGEEGILPRA